MFVILNMLDPYNICLFFKFNFNVELVFHTIIILKGSYINIISYKGSYKFQTFLS